MSGHGLAEAFERHPIIPLMFRELVTVGEETNTLHKTMKEAATAYQKQFERRLDAVLTMLEPASTVLVGGVIGFIAFSMFAPIYQGLKGIK